MIRNRSDQASGDVIYRAVRFILAKNGTSEAHLKHVPRGMEG